MKKVLILTFCFALHSILYATNYYIASTGNDASDGKTIANAFASISRINQVILQPGDSVLFNRGDLFRGMLDIKQSGLTSKVIYVGAYGSGNLPILSGAEVLTGWVNTSGDVYQASCVDCPAYIQQVFLNNIRHIPARYPNAGYLSMTNVDNTNKTFTAAGLNQATSTWDGASIFVRTEQWVIDAFKVESYSSQQIEYSIPAKFYTSYGIQNHFGFFLSNSFVALDSVGEFFFDSSIKRISLLPVDPISLSTNGAEVSIYDNCIRFFSGIKFVNIENIQLEKSLKDAVFLNQSSNVRITSCRILQAGKDGIGGFEDYATYNSNLTIHNCLIRDICNTGINLTGGGNILIKENTLQSIGLTPGLGQGYDAAYGGIYCPSNSKVIGNKLDSIGYNAIHVNQYDSVMYNQCSNFGLTKNDCGGIYYWKGAHNYISYNIVHNGFGNGDGTVYPNKLMATGIYSDDYSHDNVIEYNTMFENETGIMLHNSSNTRVNNNVGYNNNRTQLYILEGSPHIVPAAIHDNIIVDNVFQCLHPSQRSLLIETEKNNVATLATFSNNWYCNPYAKEVISVAYAPLYLNGNTTLRYLNLTLSEWEFMYSVDMGSHTAYDYPTVYASYSNVGDNLILNSTFSDGIGWWWTYGNPQFTLHAVPSGPKISSASLHGHYQNKQILSEGNVGIASIPLTKDKNYLLRYKISGEQIGGIRVGMNFQEAPSSPSTTPVNLSRSYSSILKNDSILFLSNYTTMNSLVFKSTSYDGDFWLDDVTIMEVFADTSKSVPHTRSKLFLNSTNSVLTLASANNYRNLNGAIIRNNIQLKPNESIVLKDLSVVTGISEKSKSYLEIKLFPNPTTGNLFVEVKDINTFSIIKIFNLLGKELYSAPFSEEVQIPENWSNGIYILQYSNDEGSVVKRFVIKR